MNSFESNARCQDKHRYIRGTRKNVFSDGSVEIFSSAGVPFDKIEISGKTTQPLKDQAEKYKAYFENLDNYTLAGVSGAYVIKLPDEWQGKKLTYLANVNNALDGVALYLSDGESFLFSSTKALLDASGATSSVTSSAYTHLILTGIMSEDVEDENGNILSLPIKITEFWQGHSLAVTSSVVCPDFPSPIKNTSSDETKIVLYENGRLKDEISIPPSIVVNGKVVPLLFSKWDKLTIDGNGGKVIYTEGSWQRVLTGKEVWRLSQSAHDNGYGEFYYTPTGEQFNVTPADFTGYCNCLVSAKWADSAPENSFIVTSEKTTSTHSGIFMFCTDKATSLDDIKIWLQERYAEGNGVMVIVKRTKANTIAHDITSTGLGQLLLSLVVSKGENGTLGVENSLGISLLDVDYFSEANEDKATLMLTFLNENGEKIADDKSYSVRKGSSYEIIPPHIEGYTKEGKIKGIIEKDTTLDLIYKEAKDVSL